MAMMRACSVLFLLFLVAVLEIQRSLQPPLEDNPSEKDRQDAGGVLTPEDFQNALYIVDSDEKEHDEDNSDTLFEGDIIVSNDDRKLNYVQLREVVKRRKWPKSSDGKVYVPYTIPSYMSSMKKALLAKVVLEYESKTCIRYAY